MVSVDCALTIVSMHDGLGPPWKVMRRMHSIALVSYMEYYTSSSIVRVVELPTFLGEFN